MKCSWMYLVSHVIRPGSNATLGPIKGIKKKRKRKRRKARRKSKMKKKQSRRVIQRCIMNTNQPAAVPFSPAQKKLRTPNQNMHAKENLGMYIRR